MSMMDANNTIQAGGQVHVRALASPIRWEGRNKKPATGCRFFMASRRQTNTAVPLMLTISMLPLCPTTS